MKMYLEVCSLINKYFFKISDNYVFCETCIEGLLMAFIRKFEIKRI